MKPQWKNWPFALGGLVILAASYVPGRTGWLLTVPGWLLIAFGWWKLEAEGRAERRERREELASSSDEELLASWSDCGEVPEELGPLSRLLVRRMQTKERRAIADEARNRGLLLPD